MVDPAFFDQWDKQRACFFQAAQSLRFACGRVGVALDGGRRGDHKGVTGRASGGGSGGSWSYNSNDWNIMWRRGRADFVESEGAGGVAGDNQEFAALFDQEPGAGDGVSGDGCLRLGAVRKAGGIAEV